MSEKPTRSGTISRREMDYVLVTRVMTAIKSTNDRAPTFIRFTETPNKITLEFEFSP